MGSLPTAAAISEKQSIKMSKCYGNRPVKPQFGALGGQPFGQSWINDKEDNDRRFYEKMRKPEKRKREEPKEDEERKREEPKEEEEQKKWPEAVFEEWDGPEPSGAFMAGWPGSNPFRKSPTNE
jgi:hypothetical protein